jgi:hypothetical protein
LISANADECAAAGAVKDADYDGERMGLADNAELTGDVLLIIVLL